MNNYANEKGENLKFLNNLYKIEIFLKSICLRYSMILMQ
jgi:hypothetical protein